MQTQNPFPGRATTDGNQVIAGTCSEGDNIRLVTGNLLKTVSIVSIPCIGFPLAFRLVYNSQAATGGSPPVGNKWFHNWMRNLVFSGSPTNLVTYTDPSGRPYNFTASGSSWVQADSNYYFPATLVQNATNWQLLFTDGSVLTFDDSGNFIAMTDVNNNTTTLEYVSGLLTRIVEPTGRALTLGWTGSFITSVTDSNGNVTTLVYDTMHSNLTEIMGPTGCTIQYDYATPSNSLITSRTDANGNVYSYGYNAASPPQLTSVTDAETPSHTISYAYDTVTEYVADDPITTQSFSRTTLTDANGKPWEYRFDQAGMLWRVIEPINVLGLPTDVFHWHHLYWDANQQLMYSSSGFPFIVNLSGNGYYAGPRDSPNNTFRRAFNDPTLAVPNYYIDATGRVSQYTYNDQRRLTSKYTGQGHLGVQGNWVGQYGDQGYLLCAFDSTGADVESLPSYISSISMGSATRSRLDDTSSYDHLMDPRTPVHPTMLHRGNGYWQSSSAFTMTFDLTTAQSFNLSFYSNSTDQDYISNSPLQYNEQMGREVTYTVTDLTGTRSFKVVNNAGGAWTTFPVSGDYSNPITVALAPTGNNASSGNPDARISAIMFDPYDNHLMTYDYDTVGHMVSTTNGQGGTTSMVYNVDGTLQSSTDLNGNTTRYFYEDAHRNLTRVRDVYGFDTTFTYDLNSNKLTSTDANGHVWSTTYDAKNRPLTTTNPLGFVSSIEYDSAGNVIMTTDANGNQTQFSYTPTNRLQEVTDAASESTQFAYDGSGNLLTVTDPRGNVSANAYDHANRLIQTTRADGSIVAQSWDANDNLVATTSPNGNQPNLSDINLTGAANLVRNPGFETPQPSDGLVPLGWNWQGNGELDNSEAHSGEYSVRLQSTISTDYQYVYQTAPAFPPGARGLASFWALPDGSTNSTSVQAGLAIEPVAGAPQMALSPVLTLPTSSSTWQQMPLFRVDVPGDSQFVGSPIQSFTLFTQSATNSPFVWFDDTALYSLSTAMNYDGEGRLVGTQLPDGTTMQQVFDRYGRVVQTLDAKLNATSIQYDSLGRVTAVTDPLGNVTQATYDALGNRLSVTDPNSNVTTYRYDQKTRLVLTTYPDGSTEAFVYDPVSNLVQYTNNNGQVFSMAYDAANRLVERLYHTDDSTVQYGYDSVGNLISRVERNGDICWYNYDVVNRLVAVERQPSSGYFSSATWLQRHVYDAAGNRIEFDNSTAFDNDGGFTAGLYGAAHYGTDDYGTGGTTGVYGTAEVGSGTTGLPPMHWRVPPGGYDVMNRMTAYQDWLLNETTLAYDIESRLTGITYPNGSPNVTGTASYDLVGRLLSTDTAQGMTDILPMGYSYDQNSNRVGVTTGTDTYDYAVDAANRLVQEDLNRLVERSLDRFQKGTVNGVDVTAGSLSLIAMNDAFTGTLIDGDRWTSTLTAHGFAGGLEIRQNGSLLMTFPRGFSNILLGYDAGANNNNTAPPVVSYGLSGSYVWGGLQHRVPLTGDFDLQVTFNDFQGYPQGIANAALALIVTDSSVSDVLDDGNSNFAIMQIDSTPEYQSYISNGGSPTTNSMSTTDTSGMLRIVRSGSTVTTYYYDSGWQTLGTVSGFVTDTMYVGLVVENSQVFVSASLSNFQSNLTDGQYPTSGTYTSTVYDAGRSVTWNTLDWTATVPAGAGLEFQIATSSSPTGPFNFVGPDGTSSTYFTTSGTSVHSGTTGQYAQYQATLSGTGAVTPTVSRVDLLFGGTNTSTEIAYSYDGAGNMVGKVTEVYGSTTVTETRTVNNLNQITANTVVGAGTTNWTYAYDANGNMTSRTNVTLSETTTYTWDEDNRLTLVTLPSAATVAYTYDRLGRMLTRTDTSGTTTFVWDGTDCIQETDPSGNVTRYYALQGMLMSFDRTVSSTTTTYQIHRDALGSVRKVTDESATVQATYDYDAWGNQLGSTSDSIPNGGLQYRFVGGLGVRWDATTGLYYMRNRWYDPTLGRFLTRDIRRSFNRYAYASNRPLNLVDPNGTVPFSLLAGVKQLALTPSNNLSFTLFGQLCSLKTTQPLGHVEGVFDVYILESVNNGVNFQQEEHFSTFDYMGLFVISGSTPQDLVNWQGSVQYQPGDIIEIEIYGTAFLQEDPNVFWQGPGSPDLYYVLDSDGQWVLWTPPNQKPH